jgi:hypothetical protein
VLIGSGRARGCALLGGLIWSVVGAWIGIARDPVGRIDLTLTRLDGGHNGGCGGGDAMDGPPVERPEGPLSRGVVNIRVLAVESEIRQLWR